MMASEQLSFRDSWSTDVIDESGKDGSQPYQNPAGGCRSTFEVEGERNGLQMQRSCRLLLDELDEFQSYLKRQKKEKAVEMGIFKTHVQAEMKFLNKYAAADPLDPKTRNAFRSSNFPFFAAVWSTAKTCASVTGLGKRFYWLPDQNTAFINGRVSTSGTRHRKHRAMVDIVSQNGSEWIKVSSITEKRVLMDLAKAGWVGDSSSDEGEDGSPEDDEGDDPEGLLKQVEAIVRASRATRVRYRHPSVRLILPRINAMPASNAVARILQKIRDLGVIVQTSEDLPLEIPLTDQVLSCLTGDRFESFSDVLNIDCTILLAFASDLSHGRVDPADWHSKAISRQMEVESEDQLLPSSLWPACGARKLVCTREAAVRMQEIIEIIGTDTERRRASLMLNLDGNTNLTGEERLREFQKLSDKAIPLDWSLPIEIVDVDIPAILRGLPSIAEKVSGKLTDINQSVFFYGWATGRTTISSNRVVARDIESTIEGGRQDEETRGPDIWVCATARSLVGKEKQRRGYNDSAS